SRFGDFFGYTFCRSRFTAQAQYQHGPDVGVQPMADVGMLGDLIFFGIEGTAIGMHECDTPSLIRNIHRATVDTRYGRYDQHMVADTHCAVSAAITHTCSTNRHAFLLRRLKSVVLSGPNSYAAVHGVLQVWRLLQNQLLHHTSKFL